MNALGALLTILFCLMVAIPPRRFAPIGLICVLCYITQAQMVTVGGFHFTAVRMVLLVGMIRAIARGELKAIKFNIIDKSIIWFSLSISGIHFFRTPNTATLVGELGVAYNVLLSYFFSRSLFRSLEEVEEFLPTLAIAIIPMVCFMTLESITGRNTFGSFFGGATPYPELRDGHYRCSGAFRSPITGGTFGETLMPLFAGLFLIKRQRGFAILGIIATTIITICSRSSGPLLAYGAGVIGLLFWKRREKTRQARWIVLFSLIFLHMIMKAPVWFLMARISDIVGGGGWHRAEIVDVAVKHFREWWLIGTDDTAEWMPTQLVNGGADLTNEFVDAGVRGGLISMLALIWIIVRCYRYLGLAMKQVRGKFAKTEQLLWAMGAALFGTLINFFSVSYFDQIETVWYFLVAIISCSSFDILNSQPQGAIESEHEFAHEDPLAAQPMQAV